MATYTGKARRGRRVKVPTEDGLGVKFIVDGIDEGTITLEIDVAALIEKLGPMAMKSKSRKATLSHKMIVARASNIRQVQP